MYKKALVILSTVVILGSVGYAIGDENESGLHHKHARGGPGAGFRDPEAMLRRMSRHLELDETQAQSMENIILAARPEIDALRARLDQNRRAMRALDTSDPDYSAKLSDLATENGELAAEGTVLFGRVRSEVHALLTPEQRERMSAMAAERQERRRHGRRAQAPQ